MGEDRSDVDADVNEADEATSTQGFEVGVASIPAPREIELNAGAAVIFQPRRDVICPLFPKSDPGWHFCLGH